MRNFTEFHNLLVPIYLGGRTEVIKGYKKFGLYVLSDARLFVAFSRHCLKVFFLLLLPGIFFSWLSIFVVP